MEASPTQGDLSLNQLATSVGLAVRRNHTLRKVSTDDVAMRITEESGQRCSTELAKLLRSSASFSSQFLDSTITYLPREIERILSQVHAGIQHSDERQRSTYALLETIERQISVLDKAGRKLIQRVEDMMEDVDLAEQTPPPLENMPDFSYLSSPSPLTQEQPDEAPEIKDSVSASADSGELDIAQVEPRDSSDAPNAEIDISSTKSDAELVLEENQPLSEERDQEERVERIPSLTPSEIPIVIDGDETDASQSQIAPISSALPRARQPAQQPAVFTQGLGVPQPSFLSHQRARTTLQRPTAVPTTTLYVFPVKARAQFDYRPANTSELQLRAGHLIDVNTVEMPNNQPCPTGWVFARNEYGQGLVPAHMVAPVSAVSTLVFSGAQSRNVSILQQGLQVASRDTIPPGISSITLSEDLVALTVLSYGTIPPIDIPLRSLTSVTWSPLASGPSIPRDDDFVRLTISRELSSDIIVLIVARDLWPWLTALDSYLERFS